MLGTVLSSGDIVKNQIEKTTALTELIMKYYMADKRIRTKVSPRKID